MILEGAQLLCTTLHVNNIDAPYKATHINHPCAKWARASKENFQWLFDHTRGICNEYTERYGKRHKSTDVILYCGDNRPQFKNKPLTPFAQAMPDQYKSSDAVQAYRNYYIHEKRHLAQWKRNKPEWYI